MTFYDIAFSAAHLVGAHHDRALTGNHKMFDTWEEIGSLCTVIVSFLVMLPIGALLFYHFRLIWLGRTTIEMVLRHLYPFPLFLSILTIAVSGMQLRPKRSLAEDSNLFSMASPFANFVVALCRPMEVPSALAAHKYARKDIREENPAATGAKMRKEKEMDSPV
jgi:hypothetical protein